MNNVQRGHTAIIDSRMPISAKKELQKHFRILEVPINKRYDGPIQAHPDLFVFPFPDGILAGESVCRYFRQNHERLFCSKQGSLRLFPITSTGNDNLRYPNDCALNFACCGQYLIGNFDHIHPVLSNVAEHYAWKRLSVRQGYAKCNICTVSDGALITEDRGIADACKKVGMDVLCLETHGVRLHGYAYGFIGGASSSVCRLNDEKCILFAGDVAAHPEYEKIECFCAHYGVRPISLCNEPLSDFGSIYIVYGK